ncbi:hypothetical protein [Lysobacter enzymogenes]|uniref:hypothetical protein n=1 Tax=Lysobacter enzymogenes TaxID=69 RepID=UPI001555463D|nr:hypothetical protein [Lysobacter enzymogenes]
MAEHRMPPPTHRRAAAPAARAVGVGVGVAAHGDGSRGSAGERRADGVSGRAYAEPRR